MPVLKIFKDNFVTVGTVSVGIDANGGKRECPRTPKANFFKSWLIMQ
jgi:hypothetical protein